MYIQIMQRFLLLDREIFHESLEFSRLFYAVYHEIALHNYFMPCHALENGVATAINTSYARMMGRLDVILSNIQYNFFFC